MEFDKSKVYTSVNADEVKIGSRGYFADCLKKIKEDIENGAPTGELIYVSVNLDIDNYPFEGFIEGYTKEYYSYFYLVEEPQEKKLRPFKNTDELFTEWAKHADRLPVSLIDMPAIYLKPEGSQLSQIIAAYDNHTVIIGSTTYDMNELLNGWTFNDGSPCGIME